MIATKRSWKILLGAVFGGITLGVTARLWMRWISTEPEFSWSGSIFIVIAFTIFTTSQALVYVLRRRVKSKKLNAVVRIGGAIFSLTIFSGAGALMFPTVFLVSIGLWQKRLDKRIRYVLLALSLLIPIRQIMDFGSDFGWNLATLGRSLLFILIYSIVIALLKPTITPYLHLEMKAVSWSFKTTLYFSLFAVFAAAIFLLFTMGIPGS